MIITLPFSISPANALTVQFGTNSSTGFTPYNNNSSFVIRDNGIGDLDTTTTNPITLKFSQTIKDSTKNLDFLFEGVVTANVSFSRGILNNLSLKLSQFNITNKGAKQASPVTIRFEHAFNLNFTGTKFDLAGFPLFDGTFYSSSNGTPRPVLDTQTTATYRTFFIPGTNQTPSTASSNGLGYTATTDQITASGNIPNYQQSFKIDLAAQLSSTQISNGQIVAGELTVGSLGAGETLSLPNSACMAIINKPLDDFKKPAPAPTSTPGGHDNGNNGLANGGSNVSQGQGNPQNPIGNNGNNQGNDNGNPTVYVNNDNYDYQAAQGVCDPESVPESSSGVGIIASAVLGAGCLVNQKTKQKKSVFHDKISSSN
ncbi:MAG: hypothetical protein ACKO3K_12860 [Cuspidothrix sp.]